VAIGDLDTSVGDQNSGSVDYSGLGQQALSLPQPGAQNGGQPTFSWQQLLKNMANSFANGGRPQTGPAGSTATQASQNTTSPSSNSVLSTLSNIGQNMQAQSLQAQQQQSMQSLQNNPMGKNVASAIQKLFNWGSSSNQTPAGVGGLDTTVADNSPTQTNVGDQGSDNDDSGDVDSVWDD
jgi:hypothetical protein